MKQTKERMSDTRSYDSSDHYSPRSRDTTLGYDAVVYRAEMSERAVAGDEEGVAALEQQYHDALTEARATLVNMSPVDRLSFNDVFSSHGGSRARRGSKMSWVLIRTEARLSIILSKR